MLLQEETVTRLTFFIPDSHIFSSEIFKLILTRYRSELQRNSTAMVNMKKVMQCEKDIMCRYKLAVELGYKDEVDAIRQSEAGALVRDSCR